MTARTKVLAVLVAALIGAVAATAIAVAAGGAPSSTHNVEPMVTACKLTPAGVQAANGLQKAAQNREITPQQLIAAVCAH